MRKKLKIFDQFGRPLTRKRAYVGGTGYKGAQFSSNRTRLPGLVVDHYEEFTSFTRLEMIRRSRFLDKNVGMTRGVKKALIDHSIGSGIYPIPDTGDEGLDEAYLQYFYDHAAQADISGRMSFWELQRVRTGLKFRDGDCLTMFTRNEATDRPAFQLWKAHNCGNFEIPNNEEKYWKDGVRLGKANRPLAYRMRGKGNKYFSVPARSIRLNYMIEDGDEIRGVMALAHAIEDLNDILDILALENVAVKDNARISRVITNDSGEDEDIGDFPNQVTTEAASDYDPNDTIPLEKVFGGEIVRLRMGEKLESFASARPSATFTGFIDWLGRNVTAGTGFPYEYAWNPAGITGPAVRFVIEKVIMACRAWAASEIKDSIPYYAYVIADGIERGDLPDHPNKFRAEWIPGVEELTIDRGRADKSDIEKIRENILTLKRYYAKRGLYWKREIRQTAKEKAFLAENNVSIGPGPSAMLPQPTDPQEEEN